MRRDVWRFGAIDRDRPQTIMKRLTIPKQGKISLKLTEIQDPERRLDLIILSSKVF